MNAITVSETAVEAVAAGSEDKAWLPGPLRSNVGDEQQNQNSQQAMAAG